MALIYCVIINNNNSNTMSTIVKKRRVEEKTKDTLVSFSSFPLPDNHPLCLLPPTNLRSLLNATRSFHDSFMRSVVEVAETSTVDQMKDQEVGIFKDMSRYIDEHPRGAKNEEEKGLDDEDADDAELEVSYDSMTVQCLQLYHNMLASLRKNMPLHAVIATLLFMDPNTQLTPMNLNKTLASSALYTFLCLLQSPLLHGVYQLCREMQSRHTYDWIVTPNTFMYAVLNAESNARGPYTTSAFLCFLLDGRKHFVEMMSAIEVGVRSGSNLHLAMTMMDMYNPYTLQIIFGSVDNAEQLDRINKDCQPGEEDAEPLILQIYNVFSDSDIMQRMLLVWTRSIQMGNAAAVEKSVNCLMQIALKYNRHPRSERPVLEGFLYVLQQDIKKGTTSTKDADELIAMLARSARKNIVSTSNTICMMLENNIDGNGVAETMFLEHVCCLLLDDITLHGLPIAGCLMYAAARLPHRVILAITTQYFPISLNKDIATLNTALILGTDMSGLRYMNSADIIAYVEKRTLLLQRLRGYVTVQQAEAIKDIHWTHLAKFIRAFLRCSFFPNEDATEVEKNLTAKDHHRVFWNYMSAYSITMHGYRPASLKEDDRVPVILRDIAKRDTKVVREQMAFRVVTRLDDKCNFIHYDLVENC
jgi:hypothetical protein